MSYDEGLAARVRERLSREGPLEEKRMFGGLLFMLRGHMCCGVHGAELIVRLAEQDYAGALAQPDARPMDFTDKPLRGFAFVGPGGTSHAASLERWLGLALAHVRALPPKRAGAKPSKKARKPAAKKPARRPATKARKAPPKRSRKSPARKTRRKR